MPIIKLAVRMLDEGHKGEPTVLAISFSTIGSPYGIGSLRGIRRQVHSFQGSGVTPEFWSIQD
jgi:hypothetical protein